MRAREKSERRRRSDLATRRRNGSTPVRESRPLAVARFFHALWNGFLERSDGNRVGRGIQRGGGFRPAYNAQFTTDTKSRVIAGAQVTNQGNDFGLMPPALHDVEARTGQRPASHLVDGGFAVKEDIEQAAARGIMVYAPVQKSRKPGGDPHRPGETDSPSVAEWRARMAQTEAKEIYKLRAATAETVNADLRCFRGLDRFRVRTLPKVTCIVLWSVLACDILRLFALTS